jgi:hypothetical protein
VISRELMFYFGIGVEGFNVGTTGLTFVEIALTDKDLTRLVVARILLKPILFSYALILAAVN